LAREIIRFAKRAMPNTRIGDRTCQGSFTIFRVSKPGRMAAQRKARRNENTRLGWKNVTSFANMTVVR
jgi:hypothetical protein